MKPFVLTVRAVGSEFARRTLLSISLIAGLASIAAVALALWLTTVNEWWWLLAVLVFAAVAIGAALFVTALCIVNLLRPALSNTQKAAVGSFVDKLQRVADTVGTPVFVLVFRVVRDIVRPHEQGFVAQLSHDSTSLHTDFLALQKLFT